MLVGDRQGLLLAEMAEMDMHLAHKLSIVLRVYLQHSLVGEVEVVGPEEVREEPRG